MRPCVDEASLPVILGQGWPMVNEMLQYVAERGMEKMQEGIQTNPEEGFIREASERTLELKSKMGLHASTLLENEKFQLEQIHEDGFRHAFNEILAQCKKYSVQN